MNDIIIFIYFTLNALLSSIILNCESKRLEKWCMFMTLNLLNLMQLIILCFILE